MSYWITIGTALISCAIAALTGIVLIPFLKKIHFGQTILEILHSPLPFHHAIEALGNVLRLRTVVALQHLQIFVPSLTSEGQKIKARYPELQRVFDESYLDALWYLVLTPGSTERTIAAQRAALRRYLLERGNTVPPRRLWRPLLRMYFSSPRKLLKQPQNAIEQTEDYFT